MILEKIRLFFTKKNMLYLFLAALIAYGGFILLCQVAKKHALEIFNAKMSQQHSMKGQFSVGELTPHVDGRVEFMDLGWKNDKGDSILNIPKGSFKVKPLDVILLHIGARSFESLALEKAEIILNFDKDMKADIIEKNRLKDTDGKVEVIANAEKNLHLPEKLGSKHLVMKGCKLTVVHGKNIYTLNEVNGDFKYHNNVMQLDLKTGKFGGTMVGDSMEIHGTYDNKNREQKITAELKLVNVVPASLGLGNIWNNVFIDGKVRGTLKKPVIAGSITFPQLDLPRLHFSNVKGNYHYEDNIVHLMDVKGNAFGGNVDVIGEYNFNTREHKLFAHGHNLEAAEYFKAQNIQCRLNLDLEMYNDGTRYGTIYKGYFKSGEGKYEKYRFNSLRASFRIVGKELHFNNVAIDTKMGVFNAKTMDVINGKVNVHGVSWHHHKGK